MRRPRHLRFIFGAALCFLSVCAAAVSSFAWFQINNSVAPSSTTQTNGVSTDAIVHQDATHNHDDRYATSPNTDDAGTLSFDHSKGGDAVNYYLKVYASSGGSLVHNYQMFSNVSNSADLACFFNVNLSAGQAFKIYSANGDWYGYDSFSSSSASAFTEGASNHDIAVVTAGAYDVYLTESGGVWVTPHSDTTTSVTQGDKTGYYIIGNATDSNSALTGHSTFASGIPMYVNAAANTTDLAFYAGLRLTVGDSFSVVKDSGDTLIYYAAQTEFFDSGSGKTSTENFLTKTGYFAKDGSGNAVITNKSYNSSSSAWHKLDVRQETGTDSGAPTTTFFCRQTGYYNIALSVDQTNSSYPDKEDRVADIHVGLWDGKDVLGHRYTMSSKSGGPTRKNSASPTGTIDRIYLKENGNNWDKDSARLYVYLWDGSHSTFVEKSSSSNGSNSYTTHTFNVSSITTWTPTNLLFVRASSSGWSSSNWDTNLWNKTVDLSISSSYNTYKLKSFGDNVADAADDGVTNAYKYADGYYYFKTTNSSGSDWDDGKFTFLGSSLPTASISLSFVKNEYFKVVRLSDYKRLFNWNSFSGTKEWKTPQNMIVVSPSRDGYMSDTGYYGNCQAGKAFSCSFVFTNKSKYEFSLASYTVTLKGVYGGTQESAGSASVVSGESLTAPALPTTPHYGYSAPTSWNTQADGNGTSYTVGASVPVSGNMTLFAIYGTATTKTYYFDIYDLPNDCPLRTTFKVHAWWNQGGACETDYTATKVNNSYTHWWKVTLPYASDLHFQVHAGENHQGDNSDPFDGSATNKTIYKLTGWSLYGNDTSGTTVGTLTYEVVHTVTLYKAWKRGNVITNGDALATTYLILDGETWNVPNPLSDLFSATTGWTTPTSLHKGSNTGTEYNQGTGILISSNTAAVSLYGVYVLEEYKFRVCQSTTVEGNTYNPITGASVDWNVESDATLTIYNVHLEQGKRWYIDDNTGSHGGSTYGGTITWNTGGFVLPSDQISISAEGIASNTKADKDLYFEESSNNIRTKIGGYYDITITRASKTITAVALTSFDEGDFVVRGKGAAFGTQDRNFDPGDQFTADNVSCDGTTAEFLFGSKTFNVGDQFKLYRDQGSFTDANNWSNSFSGSSKFFADPSTSNIRSGAHNTVTVKGSLNVTTGAFSIAFSSESETNYSNIEFDHAQSAGIYIETTSTLKNSSPDWSASQKIMMHATAAQYDYSSSSYTYQAQESPFTTSGGTMYMRIFRTKSNNSSTAPTDEDTIRSLTEDRYYKTTDDLSSSGFTENGGGYLVVTASGNWTISLRQDNHFNPGRGPIEIAQFSGNESIGVEHTVPYWLIGTGKPGSELRNSDFTIGNGKRLYTYGGNSGSLPAYVGAVGGTGSSSAPYGSGITLKKGDCFAISTSSDKVSSVNGSSGTGWSASSGIITITQSGKYRIWLVDSSGPQINISQVSSTSDLDQDGGTNVVGYDKEYGIKAAGVTSPGTISFGGNLDYSLLDAYQESGYRFVIELNSKSTGVNGTMNYKVNNGNNTYGIKVRAKTASYSAGAFTTESLTPIAASGSSASDFHTATISSGNTTTVLIEVVIPPSAIKAMLAAHGTLGFSMSVDCLFQEEISAS